MTLRKNRFSALAVFHRQNSLQKMFYIFCLLSFAVPQILGQNTAKRALTAQDFDSWRSLQGSQISRDGRFVAYVMQPQDGDGELFVKNTQTGAEWKVVRGYRPPTPPPDPSDPAATQAFAAAGRLLRPRFSADSKYLFFNIEPTKADILKARKDKKKPEDFPKAALGIMDLMTGKVVRVEDVKSYELPEDGAGFVAILKNPAKETPKSEKPAATASPANPANPSTEPTPKTEMPQATPTATPVPVTSPTPRPSARKKDYGTTLILHRLADGNERTFADVLSYDFTKDGKTLVYTVSSRKEENNGIFAITPQNDAAPVALLKGAGRYLRTAWDEKQTQMAFISDKDEASAKQPKFKVYHWVRNAPTAVEIVSTKTAGFRPEFVISEKANLSFSYDGTRLFLGGAPPVEAEDDSEKPAFDDEKVAVDLWHWKDDYIQPMQKVRMIADRDRSYRGVWHIKDQKFVQLADTTMENVNPSPNGLYAIGTDDRAYRIRANYDPGFSDVYLINTVDGTRKPIRQNAQFGASWSPDSKYVLFFDGKDWNTYSVADGKTSNLTGKLKVKFSDEEHDTPNTAAPYGIGSWTKGDDEILIYDRYDIWQVKADGSGAKLLTAGRKDKTAFRYVRLDPEERFIEPNQTLLLSADGDAELPEGYYHAKLGATPEKLISANQNFSGLTKAKDADTLMYQASRFDMFPDVWVTNLSFNAPKKLSDGDAQRAPFNWGRSEIVNFKSKDGVPLKGILVKPENFDPNKKYPMMVYIYEKLTDNFYNFQNPGPGTSVNFTHYVSNDYLVFMPDIVYKIGYPGQSAMNCVMPGVDAVVKQGFVNEKAIGIQGHSWGGYQIAYMVTQTDRFAAAAPGALVSNMFSAYNGIRWGTGLPRQFQYERTQSRIGGNIWDSQQKFMENSPLFYVPNVKTPILMLHNDNDDAVPWYQGIEYYLALRRLNKEVYFFNYNGEYHGLRRRANQKDYSRRMFEFFNNKLKGAPAPDWMQKGIRYLDREKEKEQYRQPVGDSQKK